MKRILISWIGQNDLNACTNKEHKNAELGPLMGTCQELSFSKGYFLYNYEKKKVKPYLAWLDNELPFDYKAHAIKLSSPIAFGEIYPAVDNVLKQIVSENPGAQLSILLSPGTPAMQAVSILLGKTKYSVDFIQSSLEQGVQEITLPFDITAEFIPSLQKQQDEQLKSLSSVTVPDTAEFNNIITKDKAMLKLKKLASILAQRDVPVLIYGESGTGKELFARAIHNSSPRKTKPFVAVNCGAIPPDLIDSILFGHKKGAFSGAIKDTNGYFQEADGGTLFLDEFGELPKSAQVRLLRVLQENTVKPVGATKEETIDIRIIAATNKNLNSEIAKGNFREDLFYRVAVGVLNLPPLRERVGDLGILSQHLLDEVNKKASTQTGYKDKNISIKAKNLILKQSWPGNVRELYSTLLRASLWSTSSQITDKDLQDALFEQVQSDNNILSKPFDEHFKIQDVIDELRLYYVNRALTDTNNSITKAAKLLGLSNYQTLSQWIEKYNIKIT